MKIQIREKDLKTLTENEKGLWSYEIQTKNGKVIGSDLPNPDEAVKQAEGHLVKIMKSMLEKPKKKRK